MKDTLGGIAGLIVLAFFAYWAFLAFASDTKSSATNKSNGCPTGYHLEGYVTQYGDTVTDCFPN